MRQIIIGREGNQPFTINDEYVSRQHAVFTYDERTGLMTLTDKSRPEVGTFVKMGNQFQQISHIFIRNSFLLQEQFIKYPDFVFKC